MVPLPGIYWVRYIKPNGLNLSVTRYSIPSIKETEQEKRGDGDDRNIKIKGPNQKRSKDVKGALKSRNFKKALFAF